jgi:hypothetical protein
MLAIVRYSSTSCNRTLKQLNAPVINIPNNTPLIWIEPVQNAAANTRPYSGTAVTIPIVVMPEAQMNAY